jgi:hypothetical protein
VPLPSHPTSCTPTKSNLYFHSYFETVIREPAVKKLLTFHNLNLVPILRRLGCLSKKIRPGPRLCLIFHNQFIFHGEGLLAPRPTPSRRITPCHLPVVAYSIYSQLPSISNLRMCHAVVTGTPPNMDTSCTEHIKTDKEQSHYLCPSSRIQSSLVLSSNIPCKILIFLLINNQV